MTSSDQLDRIELRASAKLRWPWKHQYYKPNPFRDFLESGTVLIRNPFDPIQLLDGNIDWTMDPNKDRTWRLYFHSLYWMTLVFYGLDLKEDQIPKTDRERLQVFLRDAINSFVEYYLETDETAFPDSIYDDHSVAYRLSYIALAYRDYIGHMFTEPQKDRLFQFIDRHVDTCCRFANDDKWELSNHRLFQLEGICDAAVSFYDGSEKQRDLLSLAKRQFETFVHRNVSLKDGSTKEHSVFYHIFLLDHIRSTAAHLEQLGFVFAIDFETLFIGMNRFLWNVIPAGNIIPGVGDTKFDMRFGMQYLSHFDGEQYEDGTRKYVQSQGKEGIVPRNLTAFTEDGYYVFRRGHLDKKELYSLLLEKTYVGPHGHSDGGSFITYYNQEAFFADGGGPFRYGDKLRYYYFQTQYAHNCVIFGEPRKYLTKVRQLARSRNIDLAESYGTFPKKRRWSRVFGQAFDDVMISVDYVTSPHRDEDIHARFLLAPEIRVVQKSQDNVELIGKRAAAAVQFFGFGADSGTNPLHPPEHDPRKAAVSGQMALITQKDTEYTVTNMLRRSMLPEVPLVKVTSFKHKYHVVTDYTGDTLTVQITSADQRRSAGFTISYQRHGADFSATCKITEVQ